MSNLTLNTKELTDEFFENTRLFGIIAPIEDSRFCRLLNTILDLDFRINNDIEIQLKKNSRNYFFSVFEYREPIIFLEHYLYNNRFDGEFLLPEFKNIDFLWLMKGDVVANKHIGIFSENIRLLDSVQLVVELTNEKIKNKEHLIF